MSNLQYSRLTSSRRQAPADLHFNPELLIGEEKSKDALWDAYEAKIWRREDKGSNNIL